MKHFTDFSRSGDSFEQRIGEPTEIDAAIGRIVLAFSLLADMVRGMVFIFIGVDARLAQIVTSELSFRQAVNLLGSVTLERISTLAVERERVEAREVLDEFLYLCRRAEELRNTYIHSSYHLERRVKTTAKAGKGLRAVVEDVDSALLLDVADFISETAWICQELPFRTGFADECQRNSDTLECFRGGRLIGSFTLPAVPPSVS